MNQYVKIFDTTLRDGEQSPGCSMTLEEKLKMAQQLARLNVDVIEAGFPIASSGDFEAVHRIAAEVRGPIIAGLARAVSGDIIRCAEALLPAEKKRIHTFISSSDIHLKYQFKKTREEALQDTEMAVKLAGKHSGDVEFSAMDATRSDWDYLAKMFQVAIDCGATTLNVPDTVGYTVPSEFSKLISFLKSELKMPAGVCLSVHCHNDLGLAVANSLAAIESGARQVECTVNGIGERAGNASLEEIVMTLNVRKDKMAYTTGIKTEQIYPSSKLLSFITGINVQPNKAIVGDNAFAHESGIHQDGVLKHELTYEIMTPQSVGMPRNRLVLGKHSGRHAFRDRLDALGIPLEGAAFERVFGAFKDLADRKKNVYDEDIIAIVEGADAGEEKYTLESLDVVSGNKKTPSAAVEIRVNGKLKKAKEKGDGPVDSVFKAIRKITGFKGSLDRYLVNAITGDTDAQGEVFVTVTDKGKTVRGSGAHTDIIMASGLAFLSALNRLEYYQQKKAGKGI
ncbi:MAG: 2-isopropylmalate synthase, partial [Deltaproteobacteria bacterium]|nr:2-isopropylmalate synthase [Deltaproteobacteria bacterium]